MRNYKCTKETYFSQRLFKPGDTFSGNNAPEEYFTLSSEAAVVEKPPKRVKAEGKSIKPDSIETLPKGRK